MSLFLVDGVLCGKISELQVDGDGSPRCYHPDSKSGLDLLANALHNTSEYEEYVKKGEKPPSGWAGVAVDPHGNPIVQGETPEPIALPGGIGYLLHRPHSPGFYVSTTSFLADSRFPVGDPCRYLDAQTVRYLTVTGQMLRMGAKEGDLFTIASLRGNAWTFGVLGDYGPEFGEGSLATCEALGGPASPRTGGPPGAFVAAVFLGSSAPFPRDADEISSQLDARFSPWGGLDRLRSLGASR